MSEKRTTEGAFFRRDRKGIEWHKSLDNPETWESADQIVILGNPANDDTHNCDEMGCGQRHVLERKSKLLDAKSILKSAVNDLVMIEIWAQENIEDNGLSGELIQALAKIRTKLRRKNNDPR